MPADRKRRFGALELFLIASYLVLPGLVRTDLRHRTPSEKRDRISGHGQRVVNRAWSRALAAGRGRRTEVTRPPCSVRS